MLDLSQQKDGVTAVAENKDVPVYSVTGIFGRNRVVIHAKPGFCMEKVFTVKQQLAEGTYDLGARLDVVVDRLLEKLNA